MIPFLDFINVFLFALGVALIFIVLSDKPKEPVTLRVVLFGYFLVAMQYNPDRLGPHKFLLAAAAVCFLVWLRQPVPSPEESPSD